MVGVTHESAEIRGDVVRQQARIDSLLERIQRLESGSNCHSGTTPPRLLRLSSPSTLRRPDG